jgi:pimeloyl-ACP methyl ester carboxylesterase
VLPAAAGTEANVASAWSPSAQMGNMTPRHTGFVDHDGEQIYWEEAGEGEAVVLCHGLGGNHASFWQQVPDLAVDHRVVTWDQRGFGNSTRRGAVGPAPAVGDLAALLDHLGIDSAHVVGQSMGGWAAMGFALAHPRRTRTLVLTDTLAGVMTEAIRAAVDAGSAGLTLVGDTLGEHAALGRDFVERNVPGSYLYQLLSSFGDKPSETEMFRLLGATRYPVDAVGALAVPTVLVVGEHDPLCPPTAMQLVADLIPGARLEVIPGCGHSPYFEDAPRWNRVVRSAITGR